MARNNHNRMLTLYKDADDSEQNPNNIVIQNKVVTNKDIITLNPVPGGGAVMKISRESKF